MNARRWLALLIVAGVAVGLMAWIGVTTAAVAYRAPMLTPTPSPAATTTPTATVSPPALESLGAAIPPVVDGCGGSGQVTPQALSSWLSDLESSSGVTGVNIIIEACHSGSFIDRLNVTDSLAKAGRVVISSTNRVNNAYASAQGAYFSDAFLSCLAASNNLKTCFEQAKSAVSAASANQAPWMDDNGDGTSSTSDGTVAQTRYVAGFLGAEPPRMVSANVALAGSSGVLSVNVTEGGDEVTLVWAAVYAPSFAEPTDTTLNLGVPTLKLEAVAGKPGVFRASFPNGFDESGIYRVVFYAQDRQGLQAQPVVVILRGSQAFLPLISR